MCTRCQQSPGSGRRCAFDSSGAFTPDNFQCVTANQLVEAAEARSTAGDKLYGAIYIPPGAGAFAHGGMIALSWNQRGTVGRMVRVDGAPIAGYLLTAAEAEAALQSLEAF